MFSEAKTLDEAVGEFQRTRNSAPHRFSGRWFIVREPDGFRAYRRKQPAIKAAKKASGSALRAVFFVVIL